MFQLEEQFFEELGVNKMSKDEAEAFKGHVQDELAVRIGERIVDGIPAPVLDEFEKITDGDLAFCQKYLSEKDPSYAQNPDYIKMQSSMGNQADKVLSDYAGLVWLRINHPDYVQIMATVSDELKAELKANISKII